MHICTNADLCCWALQVLAKKSGSSSSSKSRRRRNGDDSGETASSFLCGGFTKTRILCETTWIYPMRFWVAYWLLGWASAVTAAALGWGGVGGGQTQNLTARRTTWNACLQFFSGADARALASGTPAASISSTPPLDDDANSATISGIRHDRNNNAATEYRINRSEYRILCAFLFLHLYGCGRGKEGFCIWYMSLKLLSFQDRQYVSGCNRTMSSIVCLEVTKPSTAGWLRAADY